MQPNNKLAKTSLTLALLGWLIYILQWCFDLTIGLLLAAATGGTSAVCSTVFDVLPLILWLVGIVTGHAALVRIKHEKSAGHSRAVWGLVLNYFGLLFVVIVAVGLMIFIGAGLGGGILLKIFPFLHK